MGVDEHCNALTTTNWFIEFAIDKSVLPGFLQGSQQLIHSRMCNHHIEPACERFETCYLAVSSNPYPRSGTGTSNEGSLVYVSLNLTLAPLQLWRQVNSQSIAFTILVFGEGKG